MGQGHTATLRALAMPRRSQPRDKRERYRPPAGLHGNTGPLRRAAATHESVDVLLRLLYAEIMRLVEEGRVPLATAVEAVEAAAQELDDRRAEASLTWSESQAPLWDDHGERGAAPAGPGLGWKRGRRPAAGKAGR